MNRLWVRLAFAFIGVTLITIAVVALVFDRSSDAEFRRYMMNPNRERPPAMGPLRRAVMMQAAEEEFLNRLRSRLLIVVVTTSGASLVLGVVISRTIAAPLMNLANAAHAFAAHQWDHRIPVHPHDTAEIVEVAAAFNAMADELERAETLRRNLMADIAHELRTPLTVMQGSLRALLDGVYPLELKEVASLYDETRLLSRLVADLHELALAEAGKLPLHPRALDVLPILQSTVNTFSAAAETQSTALELETPPTLPPLYADPDRLTQVLHNLLVNALRHTPGGKIILRGDAAGGRVRIGVSDTGEGIAPDDLPHVFDRFYHASSRGTGLGLAIAKAWVEAMGGEIGVESAAGQGSTFWFTLRAV